MNIIPMSASTELDPVFRYALKLLHSPNADSAEKIRNALDDVIKQRHGPNKMLANTLNNKYLAEESLASGSSAVHRRHSHRSSDSKASSSSKSSSSPSHLTITTTEALGISPLVISVADDDEDVMMEEDHLKELEDLMCVACRRMDVSARNRLIECSDCHSLYHQECHKPQISDSDANEQEFSWCCALCKNKIKSTAVASPAKSSSSHSSSSSSSSYHKPVSTKSYEPTIPISSSKSKTSSSSSSSKITSSTIISKSSSSSSHPVSSSGNGGNSSSSKITVTPNINIISADKRLQNMKKKAAKLQETRRKHK